MKTKRTFITRLSAALAAVLLAAPAYRASALDEITVAYFLEWPTANQIAQVEKWYDREMGVKVNWRAFETGVAMSAAMASGDVQIAYSQGLVPFTLAVSKGLPIKTVGIAVSYAENDNCVVHRDAGITKANAKDLEGKRVAVPFGTVPYYKLLRQFEHLGVDLNKVKLVDMPPPDGAAALSRGDLAMACGWGGSFARMKEYGKVLLTAQELQDIGIIVFDVVSVLNSFAEEHPDMVVKFLQVTEDANNAYKANPKKYLATIAKAAGMDEAGTADNLGNFVFPSRDEQLSSAWLGGTVQDFTQGVGDFLAESGDLPRALPDYGATIDDSFLKQVK
jgi:taurine transport system substrate-binding protein